MTFSGNFYLTLVAALLISACALGIQSCADSRAAINESGPKIEEIKTVFLQSIEEQKKRQTCTVLWERERIDIPAKYQDAESLKVIKNYFGDVGCKAKDTELAAASPARDIIMLFCALLIFGLFGSFVIFFFSEVFLFDAIDSILKRIRKNKESK